MIPPYNTLVKFAPFLQGEFYDGILYPFIWHSTEKSVHRNITPYSPQAQHLQGFASFLNFGLFWTIKCANIVAWTRNKKAYPHIISL